MVHMWKFNRNNRLRPADHPLYGLSVSGKGVTTTGFERHECYVHTLKLTQEYSKNSSQVKLNREHCYEAYRIYPD